ncbi:MAG: 2-dehydropantoate 2-reductase [Acidimicrobiales bacterium]|nr:2-dehydropantoate 2-reductase [Acidimicrobiales bacterium]
MRYVVYGAGAIGGTIGGLLFDRGHDVVLIARGAHHAALADRGLELRTPARTMVLPIPVVAGPAELELGADDVVVLAMKTQDTPAALDALVAVAGPEVAVACAQNGVENERLALRMFPRVHGVCVALPAEHVEPGVVIGYGAPAAGILDVGRYPGGTDAVDEQMAADLVDAGFVAVAEPDVMDRKYAKLLLNLSNVLEAAGGHDAFGTDLYDRARAEAEAVYAAAGIPARSDDDADRRQAMRMTPVDGHRRDGGSTWQSLVRGASRLETDWLNGEIVWLGRRHGVPTPVNEGLQRLGRRLAATAAGTPGAMTVDELRAEVG